MPKIFIKDFKKEVFYPYFWFRTHDNNKSNK